MGKLLAVAEQWLEKENVPYKVCDKAKGQYVHSRIQGDNAGFDVIIDSFEDKNQILVFVYFANVIPPQRKAEIVELISYLNSDLLFGCFEMADESTLRFRDGLNVADGELTLAMLHEMVVHAFNKSDRLFVTVSEVCYGAKSAQHVLSRLRGEGKPPSALQ